MITDISPILLVGAGFFLGVLFSIGVLDKMYKELMKKALEEVGKQYSRALDIVEGKSKCSQEPSKE